MQNNSEHEENDDGQNLAYLPADHVLLQKLQKALREQLINEHERVDLDLTKIEEDLKIIEREKEDVGVRLYGVQQQLAENQMNFEHTNENYNLVQRLRVESEQKKGQLGQVYVQKKGELQKIKTKFQEKFDELQNLNRTLKQIEDHNQEIDGAIKVAQRTTLRAEENVVQLEKEKKRQDVLIDQMNEQIKRLEEQKTILTAQLLSQKEETAQAEGIYREAQLEMSKIIHSKKNLLEKWQQSLINMQRRDNALQNINVTLKAQQENNIQLGSELIGINNQIRNEQKFNELMNQQEIRLNKELEGLVQERKKLDHDKEKLEAQKKLLEQSLQNTENKIKEVEGDQKETDRQMQLIENNIMQLHTETKKLITKYINNVSEHKTIEKEAANLNKQGLQVALEIEDKEVELENIKNEINRVQLDTLNTDAQIELLKNRFNEVSEVKLQLERNVKKFQMMISSSHDFNEKKQKEVARLNKQYDQLQSNVDTHSKSDLEQKLAEIKIFNEQKTQEVDAMEKEWTNKQTILVKKHTLKQELQEKQAEMQVKQTVLEQKKQRLNQVYLQHNREIQEIDKSHKFLWTEMIRLNGQYAIYLASKEKLKNENLNINSEFVQKLKQLEQQAVVYEVQVDQLKEEKAELLQEIIESERQILLWERKIKLERDMQKQLQDDKTKEEQTAVIPELKKKIHQMELTLEELRKEQEKKIHQMERSIYKREAIQVKYMKKQNQPQPANAKSSSQLAQQTKTFKQQLNLTLNNTKQLDTAIRNKLQELNAINANFEEMRQEYQMLEHQVNDKNMILNQSKVLKLINLYKISALQVEARTIQSFLAGNHKLQFQEPVLKQKYQELTTVNNNLKEIINRISVEQQYYGPILDPILEIL